MALSNNGNGIDAGVRSLVLALNSRLEALWRRAQRWAQAELWEVTA